MTYAPHLSCPSCGQAAVPAHGRASLADEKLKHSDTCECGLCVWVWYEGEESACPFCSARLIIRVSDGMAYASEA